MKLPIDFENRMKEMLGEEYESFYNALLNNPIKSGIRINTLKEGAEEKVIKEIGERENIPWCNIGYFADKDEISGKHPYHAAGLFYFQEPSAMSAGEGIEIKEGDYVLDLCAAPGGKSTQIAAKLNGTGLLVSNEIVRKRAEILSENIERMGIKNAVVTNESPENLAKKYPHFFDKIIVDAPCSGEGMFRKEPQAVLEWSIEHTISCASRQKNILDSAFKMLRPGGYLVYSTCTFARAENEDVAEYVLNNYDVEICDMPKLSMLTEGFFGMKKARRIFPHRDEGEGHFVVLFHSLYKGEAIRPVVKEKKAELKDFKKFADEFLNTDLEGNFVQFGETLYLMPYGIDIDKVKVIRAGLRLGELKKNRFEPSEHLALALKKEDFKNTFECDFNTALSYLKGNVTEYDKKGWCAVLYNGYPLGWGKASGGVLKNHYPKHLRLK